MLLLMYDLCIQHLYILCFSNFCINNDAIFRSISQLCKISGPSFSYSKRFTEEFIIQIYLVLISILVIFTFFSYIFQNSSHFYQLSDLIFSSGKIYFLEHSQQQINLSHRLTFGLPQHIIFSAASWNNNTTSLFLPVNQ